LLNQRLRLSLTLFAATALAGTVTSAPAHADINIPTTTIDGGPLGTLNFSGGLDGYGYAITGTGPHSAVGDKAVGIESYNTFLNISKTTGLVQFHIGFLPNNSFALGLGPTPPSITNLELGPIKGAYVSLVPNSHFQVSAGFLYSAEGYEASNDLHNPNILESAAYWVQNSSGPGVNGTYSDGPVSVTVQFGDGWETGNWNVIQGYASYKFNADNTLYLYGAGNINQIPLTDKTDGYEGCPYGQCTVALYGANYIDSTVLGTYYKFTSGKLTLTPEVQYAWANANPSVDLPKYTSSLAVVLNANYRINKQWSVGALAQGFASNGDQYWYIAPNAAGFGATVTPTWQQGAFFVRGALGVTQLTHKAAYGPNKTGQTQLTSVLETGLVF
jgi:Putative beta-barrel porin-2, OmpL-like. bbp2